MIFVKNIILIGMPGCGKTTIGKILAKTLNKDFFDADDVFEKTLNIKIPDFFKNHGEDAFRIEETKILKALTKKSNAVISTGGGIVERSENKSILHEGSIVVFINRPLQNIYGDVDTTNRPLLKDDKERLFKLFDRRISKYKDFCHIEIENNSTQEETIKKIINEVTCYNG